jgi:hypothetical protein
MRDDRLANLERRLALIEAFLDDEVRKRQHLAVWDSPHCSGPINPWYRCGEMIGSNVSPVDIGPVDTEASQGFHETPVGYMTSSVLAR